MREDPTKPKGYAASKLWGNQRYTEDLVVPNGAGPNSNGSKSRFRSNSLSGNERNRLFVHTGSNYEDLSLVSGADFLADGRGFAWTDFDQDGFLDMIVTSLDVPRVRIMRNRFGDLGAKPSVIILNLSGANQQPTSSRASSNRDAIGARVLVSYPSGKSLALHKQAGEGFSVQNSGVIRVPFSEADFPSCIKVRWPSGKKSELIPKQEQLRYKLEEPAE